MDIYSKVWHTITAAYRRACRTTPLSRFTTFFDRQNQNFSLCFLGMLIIARSGLRCRAIGACSQALRSFAFQANTQFSTLTIQINHPVTTAFGI
jgi:hypothetical protein